MNPSVLGPGWASCRHGKAEPQTPNTGAYIHNYQYGFLILLAIMVNYDPKVLLIAEAPISVVLHIPERWQVSLSLPKLILCKVFRTMHVLPKTCTVCKTAMKEVTVIINNPCLERPKLRLREIRLRQLS